MNGSRPADHTFLFLLSNTLLFSSSALITSSSVSFLPSVMLTYWSDFNRSPLHHSAPPHPFHWHMQIWHPEAHTKKWPCLINKQQWASARQLLVAPLILLPCFLSTQRKNKTIKNSEPSRSLNVVFESRSPSWHTHTHSLILSLPDTHSIHQHGPAVVWSGLMKVHPQ